MSTEIITATPATVAPRMGMLGGVMRGAGARLHTDEDLPSEFQRKILEARDGEAAAQALANAALLDLAVARQALFDMTVQKDAAMAELGTYVPLLGVLRDDVRRGVASPNLRAALVAWGERQK